MRISMIEVDEANEEHLTRHGVSITEVHQVFDGQPQIRRNRKHRANTHVAIGKTAGGRRVLVPFIDLGAGRIRPVTAWEVGT